MEAKFDELVARVLRGTPPELQPPIRSRLQATFDAPPVEAMQLALGMTLDADRCRQLLFAPGGDMRHFVALLRCRGASSLAGTATELPDDPLVRLAVTALGILYLHHAKLWPLAAAFICAGGLEALVEVAASTRNVYVRSQCIDTLLQLTAPADSAFDWFAPATSADARQLHDCMRRLAGPQWTVPAAAFTMNAERAAALKTLVGEVGRTPADKPAAAVQAAVGATPAAASAAGDSSTTSPSLRHVIVMTRDGKLQAYSSPLLAFLFSDEYCGALLPHASPSTAGVAGGSGTASDADAMLFACFPGESYFRLQLAAFWLSWLRSLYAGGAPVHVSAALLDVLRARAAAAAAAPTASGSAGAAAADQGISGTDADEASLADRLCSDLGRFYCVEELLRADVIVDALSGAAAASSSTFTSAPVAPVPVIPPTVAAASGPTDEAQRLREEGNRSFAKGHYADAIVLYTAAIDAAPAVAERNSDSSSRSGEKPSTATHRAPEQLAAAYTNRAAALLRVCGFKDSAASGHTPTLPPVPLLVAWRAEAGRALASATAPGAAVIADLGAASASRDSPSLSAGQAVSALRLAVSDCDAALRLHPGHIKAQFRKAQALIGLGRMSAAAEVARATLAALAIAARAIAPGGVLAAHGLQLDADQIATYQEMVSSLLTTALALQEPRGLSDAAAHAVGGRGDGAAAVARAVEDDDEAAIVAALLRRNDDSGARGSGGAVKPIDSRRTATTLTAPPAADVGGPRSAAPPAADGLLDFDAEPASVREALAAASKQATLAVSSAAAAGAPARKLAIAVGSVSGSAARTVPSAPPTAATTAAAPANNKADVMAALLSGRATAATGGGRATAAGSGKPKPKASAFVQGLLDGR